MQNPLQDIQVLRKQHYNLGSRIQKCIAQQSHLHQREAKLVQEILQAKHRLSVKDEVKKELDTLQNKSQEKSIGLFTNLLTAMVHDVLPKNKDEEVHFALSTKRGKPNLDVLMKVGDNQFEDITSGRGGSLTNVISAGLRYVTLSRTRNRRFMVLDEPDCWLNDKAVPRFAKVISDISKKVGVQTIAISHKDATLYNSRIIELYRDEKDNNIVKARMVQESKDEGYIDSEEYEDINRTNLMDDVGIKRIKFNNYMSLGDVELNLSPTMNIIVGDLDIGKSAVFAGINAFVNNSCHEGMIQHGKSAFTIEIEIEDGIILKLEHRRTGQKKTTYQMIMPDGETISEDNGRDVPDFITDALGIVPIDGINIQLAHQKSPVFMIGPDVTSAKRAELLSLGREADYIQKMINIYGSEIKSDGVLVRNGEKELNEIRGQIELLSPLQAIESKHIEVGEKLEDMFESKGKVDRVSQIIDELEKNNSHINNLQPVKNITIPVMQGELHSQEKINSIINLGMEIKRNQDTISKLSSISQVTIPDSVSIKEPSANLLSIIDEIQALENNLIQATKEASDKQKELEGVNKEINLLIEEMGGVCPLCKQEIKHAHN